MDDKLAAEEARRSVQHDAVKSQVEGEVHAEIAEVADRVAPPETRRVEQVAGEFRSQAVDEIVETEREVGRARGLARISQIIDYLFYILYAFLGLRLVLELLAAKQSAGFMQFVNTVTAPFYGPFKGIVASPSAEGHRFTVPIIIALIVYILLHLGINALLRIFAHRKTAI